MSGVDAMLTAAHCAPSGGSIAYQGDSNAGWVKASYEENWDPSIGTVYYEGQSTYRGDVALIRYFTADSAPKIYDGDKHTADNVWVNSVATRRRMTGDTVTVNGATHGPWTGDVTDTGANFHYVLDNPPHWVKNVDLLLAAGPDCPLPGDSGGPAYRIASDGVNVVALGIISGVAPTGVYCVTVMTDIFDPALALPGGIKTHQGVKRANPQGRGFHPFGGGRVSRRCRDRLLSTVSDPVLPQRRTRHDRTRSSIRSITGDACRFDRRD